MKRLVGTEEQLCQQVAQYLRLKYPEVIYNFDRAGVHNPSPRTRAMFARLNHRAFPDLFIYAARNGKHGLGLELKKEGTRIFKKNGEPVSNPHIWEQCSVLIALKDDGYGADWGIGYEDTITKIDNYLKGE